MKSNRNILYSGLVILTLLIFGCEEESICPVDRQVTMKGGLYTISDSVEIDTIINGITISGIGVGENFYQDSSFLDQILFPLSPYSDTSAFLLEAGGNADTLIMYYTREVIFFSQDCGFLTEFNLLNSRYGGGIIDSVAILTNRVSTINEEHIKIYF